MMLESIVNPNRLTKENAAEVGNLLLKQGMRQEEVLKLLAKAEKNPNALRQLMQAGKNAMLVDQVPAGYAVSEAVLPTYGKVGRNNDGSPKFGRIQ